MNLFKAKLWINWDGAISLTCRKIEHGYKFKTNLIIFFCAKLFKLVGSGGEIFIFQKKALKF